MTSNAAALVAQLEAEAKAAQETEMTVRKQMADEVARLERNRTFAFRRVRLVRALINAATAHESEQAALAAERQAVCNELEWAGDSEAQNAILDRLQPVARSIWQCAGTDAPTDPQLVIRELESFEAWFEAAHDKSFYALFDRYVPQVPVVDF